MLENLTFAILAFVFAFLSMRPDKKRIFPIVAVIYKFCMFVSIFFAISQSFNVIGSNTSFTYVGGSVMSANTVYTYSNQGTNQDMDTWYVGGLVLVAIFGTIFEVFEDEASMLVKSLGSNYGRTAKRAFVRRGNDD